MHGQNHIKIQMILKSDYLDVEGRFVLNTHYLTMSDNQKKILYFYLLTFMFYLSDDHSKELLEYIF